MSRLASFVVLVSVILVVAVLFFRVILEFVVPMFLAAVLVVVFRPMHKWFEHKLAGHARWAAAATTICILLFVLVPIAAIGWNAYHEVAVLAREALDEESSSAVSDDEQIPNDPISGGQRADSSALEEQPSDEQADAGRPASERPTEEKSELDIRIEHAIGVVSASLKRHLHIHVPWEPSEIRLELEDSILSWARGRGGTAALAGLRSVARIIVGLVIMIISVYFFLADGPGMIVTVMHLSPLDDRYELELLNKFSSVSRAVVVATLLSAFVQGILAGIGYYIAGIHIVFFLTGLTMLLAVIPFLGAASVWAPTAAWLLLGEERPVAAAILALYGLAVVSTVDNLIKPYVLHGQSNLHPLLALLSVLGGVAAMGPIGILVGPMAVAFLQALLGMLRREIDELGEERPVRPSLPGSGESQTETQQSISETTAEVPSAGDAAAPLAKGKPPDKSSPARKDGSAERKRSKRRGRQRKRS